MPFDEGLATRLEEIMMRDFSDAGNLAETRMFGGFGYLLNGNMCLGIHQDTLIVRVGVDAAEKLIAEDGVRPMDLTGKVMKGWATVEPAAMEDDESLRRFCECAVSFVKTLAQK